MRLKLEVRKGESREEESWLVEDYGTGMERRAAGGVGRLAPEGNVLAVGKHGALQRSRTGGSRPAGAGRE